MALKLKKLIFYRYLNLLFIILILFVSSKKAMADTYNDLYNLTLLNGSYCEGGGGKWNGWSCDASNSSESYDDSPIGAVIVMGFLYFLLNNSNDGLNDRTRRMYRAEAEAEKKLALIRKHEEIIGEKLKTFSKRNTDNPDNRKIIDAVQNILAGQVIRIKANGKTSYISLLDNRKLIPLGEFKNEATINQNILRQKTEDYLKQNVYRQKARNYKKKGYLKLRSWSVEIFGTLPHLCFRTGQGSIPCFGLTFQDINGFPQTNFVTNIVFTVSKNYYLDFKVGAFNRSNIVFSRSDIDMVKLKNFFDKVAELQKKLIDLEHGRIKLGYKKPDMCWDKPEGDERDGCWNIRGKIMADLYTKKRREIKSQYSFSSKDGNLDIWSD